MSFREAAGVLVLIRFQLARSISRHGTIGSSPLSRSRERVLQTSMAGRGVEVPLRLRKEGFAKAQMPATGRQALVWACLGVSVVVLVKAVVIGGLGSATVGLLDPRYGGSDGLGVFTAHEAKLARQQELTMDAPGKLASEKNMGKADLRFARTVQHPRRPFMLHRADVAAHLGQLRKQRGILLREKAILDKLQAQRRALAALGRSPSTQPATQQPPMKATPRATWADGALARARTTVTSTDGSLSANFADDASNTYGALGVTKQGSHGWAVPAEDNGWAEPAEDNGWAKPTQDNGWASLVKDKSWASRVRDDSWAMPVKDDGWAQPTSDNGWAMQTKQTAWAAPVHDDAWASSPSLAVSRGALMSVKDDNPVGSLALASGHQDGWTKGPSMSEDMGALASMREQTSNTGGILSGLKNDQAAVDGSVSSVKNTDVATQGSLSAFKDSAEATGGSLASVKGGSFAGSLADTKSSDVDGSLADSKGRDMADGVLSVTKGGQDVGGSLARLPKSKYNDVEGSLANIKGGDMWGGVLSVASNGQDADIDGSLSNTKGDDMAGGVLSVTSDGKDVGGSLARLSQKGKRGGNVGGSLAKTQGHEMVQGSLSATKDHSEGAVWLPRAPGLRGRVLKRSPADAVTADAKSAKGAGPKGASRAVATATGSESTVESAKEMKDVQKTREEAAALQYMLGKELNEATQKHDEKVREKQRKLKERAANKAVVAAEETLKRKQEQVALKKQQQALERKLASSRKRVQKIQSELSRKAASIKADLAKAQAEVSRKLGTMKADLAKASTEKAEAVPQKMDSAVMVRKSAKAEPKKETAVATMVAGGHTTSAKGLQHTAGSAHGSVHEAEPVHESMHVVKGQQKKQQKLDDAEGEDKERLPYDYNDDDIGWQKKHWSTVAWVMFIMFGPVFTSAVVALVGYYTGTVAALATCLLLVCMDIACYYYSWFLW
jgi:hypothetical protein